MISTYGGVLGIVVGVLFGAVMQHAMMGNPLLDISIPTTVVAVALVGKVVVGVMAGPPSGENGDSSAVRTD